MGRYKSNNQFSFYVLFLLTFTLLSITTVVLGETTSICSHETGRDHRVQNIVNSISDDAGYISAMSHTLGRMTLNDGYVIIHGVEDFLDPAVQTLSWYDNDDNVTMTTSSKSSTELGGFIEGLVLVLMEGYNVIWLFAVFIVVSFLAYPVCVVFFGEEGCILRRLPPSRDDEYVQLFSSSSDVVLDV